MNISRKAVTQQRCARVGAPLTDLDALCHARFADEATFGVEKEEEEKPFFCIHFRLFSLLRASPSQASAGCPKKAARALINMFILEQKIYVEIGS